MIDFSSLFANPVFSFSFSAVTFVLGNLFAYWLYRRSLSKKQIWWDAHRKKLTNTYLSKIPNLKLQYEDQTITDVSVLRLMIWSAGKDVIRQEDIAKNHPIRFVSCENTKLLMANLIVTNNDTISIFLNKELNELDINFEYLELNQGIVVEIAYTGSLDKLGVIGVIKGGNIDFKRARSEYTDRRLPFSFATDRLSYRARRQAMIFFTAFAGLFLFTFFVPLTIDAFFYRTTPIDSGFWFVVPRMGIFALLYFWIMANILRTPKIPSGLEVFEQSIA